MYGEAEEVKIVTVVTDGHLSYIFMINVYA